MTKSYYSVPIVKRELLPLWNEVWDGDNPLPGVREAKLDDFLGQARIIKARNKLEAAAIAEQENPGHVVIHEAIVKR